MALTAIEPTAGITAAERRRAQQAGPIEVMVRTSYRSLMTSAGFVEIGHRDVTAEYRVTLAAWMAALRRRSRAIVGAIGEEAHEERITTGIGALAAIDEGVLSRSLYWATRR